MTRHTRHKVRLKITIHGAVQGVGFRPFVFRLAEALGLVGWVNNSSQGVVIEVEGAKNELDRFLIRLEAEKPPRSFIQSLEASWLDPAGYRSFEIRPSDAAGSKTALVLPDIATCPDCLREVFDPANRRYFYPFTNCTNCGPRFSIIEALPYDRPNTSMKKFAMCPQCQAEYENPRDRRFHAQPNACPVCGPHLELWDSAGRVVAPGTPPSDGTGVETTLQAQHNVASDSNSQAVLETTAEAVRQGQIVAVKGLGGFHLLVAGHNEEAVRRLRERKHREEKPLALMFPSLAAIIDACEVSPLEERLLLSPEAPIVLLRRRKATKVPPLAISIAPRNPNLGAMLPYTPLHHLLLSLLGFPVVATSGNLSDEPICIDESEAVERLRGIADLFLVHNRPIARHVDDSIVRVVAARNAVMRRARGFAPLPIQLPNVRHETPSVLAVGAHLKNTVALSVGSQVFMSQHIGDLETEEAYAAFRRVISDFERLYQSRPEAIAADLHPEYLSTKFARELVSGSSPSTLNPQPSTSLTSVQHHVAHVLSCMAENELPPPALGVAWDGTGYGLDGTIWGGEFFLVTDREQERVAHFRQFPLPGGEQAIKEPRRTALGLLFEVHGEGAFALRETNVLQAFSSAEMSSLRTMLGRQLNSPRTSSVGRLFDGIAALLGIRHRVRFEGQAAMELEFALEGVETEESYPIVCGGISETGQRSLGTDSPFLSSQPPLVVDWSPLVQGVLADLRGQVSAAKISAKFHNALVESIIAVARRMGQKRVVLSGGCFQNRYLLERGIQRLEQEGFHAYWHQRVPPNDGGIALGQAVALIQRIS